MGEESEASDRRLIKYRHIADIFGTAAFLFNAHGVIPTLYEPMKSKSRFPQVAGVAFGAASLFCLILGVSAYYFFADNVQPNVAANIGYDSELKEIPGLAPLRMASN